MNPIIKYECSECHKTYEALEEASACCALVSPLGVYKLNNVKVEFFFNNETGAVAYINPLYGNSRSHFSNFSNREMLNQLVEKLFEEQYQTDSTLIQPTFLYIMGPYFINKVDKIPFYVNIKTKKVFYGSAVGNIVPLNQGFLCVSNLRNLVTELFKYKLHNLHK